MYILKDNETKEIILVKNLYIAKYTEEDDIIIKPYNKKHKLDNDYSLVFENLLEVIRYPNAREFEDGDCLKDYYGIEVHSSMTDDTNKITLKAWGDFGVFSSRMDVIEAKPKTLNLVKAIYGEIDEKS